MFSCSKNVLENWEKRGRIQPVQQVSWKFLRKIEFEPSKIDANVQNRCATATTFYPQRTHNICVIVLVLEKFLYCFLLTHSLAKHMTGSLTLHNLIFIHFIFIFFLSLISLSFLNDILKIKFHKQDINRHMSVLLLLFFLRTHQHARDYSGGT